MDLPYRDHGVPSRATPPLSGGGLQDILVHPDFHRQGSQLNLHAFISIRSIRSHPAVVKRFIERLQLAPSFWKLSGFRSLLQRGAVLSQVTHGDR